MNEVMIRSMDDSDRERVLSIYEEGIRTGNATFETSAGSWEQWDAGHLKSPRLVAESAEEVVGWAALSPVSGRCVYGGVAEVSVYVSSAARGKGIGVALLTRLTEESEKHNIWTLQAGIFPENEASIKIHEKAGFRTVGIREKLGKMDGRWRDVVLMERRSEKVGVE
jgi:L-amino acid N-acyltransferase YncA